MITLRPLTTSDIDTVVGINNEGHPGVPLATAADMGELLAVASVTLGAVDDEGHLVGFLIAVDPGQPYESENYAFFESRFDNHLYVDRIVLSESSRGLGVGSSLYERVSEVAGDAGRDCITCEVNLEPPNPGSLRFHHRLGFVNVDTQSTKGGSVVVQLLQMPLPRS